MRLNLYVAIILLLNSIPKFCFSQTTDSTTSVSGTNTEWIYIGSNSSHVKYYIRSNYVSKKNNEIKIWIKSDLKSVTVNKKIYTNVEDLELYVFDCYNKKYKSLSLVEYSSIGEVIYQGDFSDTSTFEDVVPDSVIENILKRVCEYYNN